MSWTAVAWAKNQKVGNSTGKLVLLALAECADQDGQCWPSYGYLADVAECSTKSVERYIEKLEGMGLLTRTHRRRRSDGRLGSYYYILNVAQVRMALGEIDTPEDKLSTGQNDDWSGQPTPVSDPADTAVSPGPADTGVGAEPATTEPSGNRPGGTRAPAREAQSDQGGKRTITFAGTRLDVSAAPESLSDEAIQELLAWQRERDPRWRPTLFGVQQTMRELAKAAAKGWEPEQAIGIWQQAGWSTFQAHYLDRMADEGDSETSNANTDEAWARLVRHCRGGHSISDVEAADAALAEAARNLGGMTYLRRLTERDLEFQKRKFPPLYRAALQQQSSAVEA